MDINTALVCAAVFIFSAVMVYLISVFGMKERTYEEAIEEQRRRNQEASYHMKHDKSKKEKKFKKWGRRCKDKSTDDEKLLGEESIEQEHIHSQHPEFKTGSEMMEEDSDIESKILKPKKNLKLLSSKLALANRDEGTQPSSSEETDEDTSQGNSLTKDFDSNDDPKLGRDDEASDTEQLEEEKLKGTNEELEDNQLYKLHEETNDGKVLKSVDIQKISEMTSLASTVSSSGRSSPNKKKKTRNENGSGDKYAIDLSGSKLISALKHASLSDDEMQMVIDILLNKQGSSSEWMKRNDPVTTLKRQLQEKELALETEQRLVQAANTKLKELRQDLVQEKSRSGVNERSLREKITQQQQEIQNLHNRMQCTHEQQLSERSALQSKLQQMEQVQSKISEEHNLTVQRLQEEKSKLQQALSRLETEHKRNSLEITRLQCEVEQLLSSREQCQVTMQQAQDDLHHQIQQLEDHIQKLLSTHKEDEFSYKQHLNDMSNKLQQAESSQTALAKDLQDIQTVCTTLESDNSALQQRLEEAERVAGSKTLELQQLQRTLEEAHKKHVELASCCDQLQGELLQMKNKDNKQTQQINDMKKENEELSLELANFMKQLSEIEQAGLEEKENKIDLKEHKQILDRKESECQELYQQVNKYRSEIDIMRVEMESHKSKNSDLQEENWKALEAVTAAEKAADYKLQEAERIAADKIQRIEADTEEEISELKKEVEKLNQVQSDLVKANEMITTLKTKVKDSEEKVAGILKDADMRVLQAQQSADDRVEQILREAAEKYNELHQDLEERLKEVRTTANEEISNAKKLTEKKTQECRNMQDTYHSLCMQIEEKIGLAVKATEKQMEEKQKDRELKLNEQQKMIGEKNNQIDTLIKEHDKMQKFLQRLFPDIKINQQLYTDDWLREYEEKASNILNDYKKVVCNQKVHSKHISQDDQSLTVQDKEHIKKLEAQVLHYKTVLSETEGILNKLQSSIESEEQGWIEKLSNKEQELQKHVAEKEELLKEKSILQNHLKEFQTVEKSRSNQGKSEKHRRSRKRCASKK